MWLATQHGLYSIVQKTAGRIHVRTRCRKDLENLIYLSGIEAQVHNTTAGDYAWRIIVGHPELSAIMAALAASIDYPNFKARIHEKPDQKCKLPAYSRLWSHLLDEQRSTEPEPPSGG